MNKKLTTGFPTSYRWIVYVTLMSPTGGSKSVFVYLNKIQFQSKTATKFLCVKTFRGKIVAWPFPRI